MTHTEKFLYDLQGFLLIRDFLSESEVRRLNQAVDENWDQRYDDPNRLAGGNLEGTAARQVLSSLLTWEKPWCLPFRDLLAHPKLVPYLDVLLGRGWKMDHAPFILTCEKGGEGLRLHGTTSEFFDGTCYYRYANGQMRSGMVVCQYQLADVAEGDGGFCVIPGSHKANFECPDEILKWQEHRELVYNVPARAGDLILFNEATLHGTLPWTADHPRRSLLYRFSPKYLHFAGGTFEVKQPDWVSELTEAQRAVLEPPYVYDRPAVAEDGITVERLHYDMP